MAYMILEKTTGHQCGDGRVGLPFRWRVKESTFEIPLPDMDVVGLQFPEPIGVTQNDIDTFPDEFTIERTGSCNQCGYCCGWVSNHATDSCCQHVKTTGNPKGICLIYASLTVPCSDPDCDKLGSDGTHSDCLPPPHQPYHRDNEDCGYTFTVTTAGNCLSNKEVVRMYWASDEDLTGKWIR